MRVRKKSPCVSNNSLRFSNYSKTRYVQKTHVSISLKIPKNRIRRAAWEELTTDIDERTVETETNRSAIHFQLGMNKSRAGGKNLIRSDWKLFVHFFFCRYSRDFFLFVVGFCFAITTILTVAYKFGSTMSWVLEIFDIFKDIKD